MSGRSRLARAGVGLFLRDAAAHVRDPAQAAALVETASIKAQQTHGRLADVWQSLTTLFRMIKAYMSGRYRNVSARTLMWVVAGLLYFVSPLDFVPDVVFAMGLVDDVAVLAFVLAAVQRDLDAFRAWENASSCQAEQTP